MKLATFLHHGIEYVGLVSDSDQSIHPVTDRRSMLDLVGTADMPRTDTSLRLAEVRLLAPIPRPVRSIFCVGKNYRDHALEFVRSGFDVGADAQQIVESDPIIFTKLATSVVGPYDDVELHEETTQQVDYEGELAIVIGRPGRNILAQDAMDYVWGYTIVNDVTARDLQKRHRQWDLGKSLDTFCPMGPWITTADEIDFVKLTLRTEVNGEERQSGRATEMIHSIPRLIATISSGITLLAGDVIATGTPAGVGIGLDPPQFLRQGDEVRVSIDGLGSIQNTFR
ncbi:MAG: fumarylacetoacetate hydrolase family protein [Gammaproteobacteria bacterium]|nr:fumarylacetoacetate hydrolase family protein [Gammaproteobacteria bacterium]